MKKGNKVLFSLFAIGLCLLPFSLNKTLSIYVITDDDVSMSVSGKVQGAKKTINIYLPTYGESETFILTDSISVDSGTILRTALEDNNFSFDTIDNKFSYTGNIFSDSSLSTLINLSDQIISDISIYPEYVGYGVKGSASSTLEFLSFVDDPNYNYGSLIPIDGSSANIYKHILTKEYAYEYSLGEYKDLNTTSGQYYVKFNSSNNANVFERYFLFNCESWQVANAYVKFNCYKYGDGNGNQIIDINYQSTKVVDGVTYYELFLTPYRNLFFYERYDSNNLNNRWNCSGTIDFIGNYTKNVYKFKTGSIYEGSIECQWL